MWVSKAKGLRTSLCVRIVHTKVKDNAVLYVLRVEDVETGLQWVAFDFSMEWKLFHHISITTGGSPSLSGLLRTE